MSHVEVQRVASILHCAAGSFPFIYLGLPVASNMRRVSSWTVVEGRCSSKLNSWNCANMSMGGRLTLSKSILGSLPLYYFSLFRVSSTIPSKLEKMRNNFLWGRSADARKMIWANYSKTCGDKESGSLNVRSFKAKNISLLAKWWSRFRSKGNSLLIWVIKSIYGSHGGLSSPRPPIAGGPWKDIVKTRLEIEELGVQFNSSFARSVGNGSSITFWTYLWFGQQPLSLQFKRLFALELQKDCLLRDCLCWEESGFSWVWRWRHEPHRREATKLQSFLSFLESLSPSRSSEDAWSCQYSPDKYLLPPPTLS